MSSAYERQFYSDVSSIAASLLAIANTAEEIRVELKKKRIDDAHGGLRLQKSEQL